jgi:uncharacterized protein (DUF302 family)
MKTLLIEKSKFGSSESEVIMLHDQENKISRYIYTSEYNYEEWVRSQANAFRNNGYKIFNTTDIKIN